MSKKKLDYGKIKQRIMDIGLKTGVGHIASALTLVRPLCRMYNQSPDYIHIVSKGHGVLAQYVILNELGILPDEVLDTYYQDGGLSEHSTLSKKYGIYASTGSLGHGLGIGIGYAIANPDRLVVVYMSDGELDCGPTLSSLKIANKLKLNNIIVVVDHNRLQAFSESRREDLNLFSHNWFQTFNGTKGEAWGDIAGTMESHYTKVTQEVYDIWMKEYPVIDKRDKELDAQVETLTKERNKKFKLLEEQREDEQRD